MAPEEPDISASTFMQEWSTRTGGDVDHVAVVHRGTDCRLLLLLHPRLEHPYGGTVDIARDKADARMSIQCIRLQFLDQPIALFL